MRVYLVRHAIALAREESDGITDVERPLTPKGVSRMREIVAALARQGESWESIWTSPLVRAIQTAALLTEARHFDGEIRTDEGLEPGGDMGALIARLGSSGLESVALVGHEPDMGMLAARLIGGRGGCAIQFKKGGVACVEFAGNATDGGGELAWLMTPRQMRAMGG